MDNHAFQRFEIDCIYQAAGQDTAEIRSVSTPIGTHRCRTYILEGQGGSVFVKCLDAGYRNSLATLLTLEHEAEGYRFFSDRDDLALAHLEFCQVFSDGTGRELQVLGVSNLGAQDGILRTLLEFYGDPTLSGDIKEAVAKACGQTLARLVSADFQSSLDRGAGAVAVRRQTDCLLEHPLRQELLNDVKHHPAFPWAYHNRVIGEMNILVPRWLQEIRKRASHSLNGELDLLGRILTNRDLVSALAPGQSADRIIFSPCDRRIDNTLCLSKGEDLPELYEVDLEYWGVETAGRLIGRYLAHWQLSMLSGQANPGDSNLAWEERSSLYHQLAAAFCYHFLAGDETESAESVLRAIGLGLAGFHAGLYYLHRAAVQLSEAQSLIPRALDSILNPDKFLRSTRETLEEPKYHDEPLMQSIEQVLDALQPITNTVQSAIGLAIPQSISATT